MKKTAIFVALVAVTGTTAVFPVHDKMSMQIPSAYSARTGSDMITTVNYHSSGSL
jgi:hypothetical protein